MRKLALFAAAIVAAAGATAAQAHNAGHIFIDGKCLEVGSSKEAPLVGPGAPQNAIGQLDLIYDPQNGVDVSDQYGARWAAIRGKTPILPGNCPA
jgi:outer membrane protein W